MSRTRPSARWMVIESDARLGTKTGYKAVVGDRPARAPCASPMKDERIAADADGHPKSADA